MPQKYDSNSSYGQKLFKLFFRLYFSGDSYSLTELTKMLRCSKQTVLRLVDDMRRGYGGNIFEEKQGQKKYFRFDRPAAQQASLTASELSLLMMCRDFTAHLLGRDFFEDTTTALLKTRGPAITSGKKTTDHFASFNFGTIDYTPHQKTISTLTQAMEQRKVCRLSYQSGMWDKPKTFYIKPLKIFAHRDTMYVHARLHKAPGKKYHAPKYDPFLPIHRIKEIELTDTLYEYPADYNFAKEFTKDFGIMKEDVFRVTAEFTGWAAQYVAERNWSEDQKITKLDKGKIRLTFTASSEHELVAWLLSFGEDVKLLKPKWLIDEVIKKVRTMNEVY